MPLTRLPQDLLSTLGGCITLDIPGYTLEAEELNLFDAKPASTAWLRYITSQSSDAKIERMKFMHRKYRSLYLAEHAALELRPELRPELYYYRKVYNRSRLWLFRNDPEFPGATSGVYSPPIASARTSPRTWGLPLSCVRA